MANGAHDHTCDKARKPEVRKEKHDTEDNSEVIKKRAHRIKYEPLAKLRYDAKQARDAEKERLEKEYPGKEREPLIMLNETGKNNVRNSGCKNSNEKRKPCVREEKKSENLRKERLCPFRIGAVDALSNKRNEHIDRER